MKLNLIFLYLSLSFSFALQAQEKDNADILKLILTKFYANEKVIVKNRLQLLRFYCQKSPNNEEFLPVINGHDFLKKNMVELKKQIQPNVQEDWSNEFNLLFNNQNQYLKSKVNACVSLEEFKQQAVDVDDNNHRLMIVGKPMYFATTFCLVKVGIYRNVEHNSAYFMLFEKTDGVWKLKETVSQWST